MSDPTMPHTPAGWYPVDNQYDRYWTGTEWSDQVRPHPESFGEQRPGGPGWGPQSPRPSTAKPSWYKRGWVIGLVALFLGMILGSATAGTADPRDSSEFGALSAELSESQEELASSEEQLASAQAELETIAGDLPAREEAVKEAEAALEERESAIAEAEAEAKAASKALAKREKAVGIAETQIARNTLPGDGIYEAGVDIKPGTYKTSGAPGCYYAVLNSPDTFDIANNNNIDGPGILTIRAGQFLELSGCADWVLQR